MHRKGVVVRDIKLDNTLLLDSSRKPMIKLCDFGFSKSREYDSQPKTSLGTESYMGARFVII